MYLIIIGAGPVGLALTELALKDKNDVVLIESNKERAEKAGERCEDARVLNVNVADSGVLDEAGADQADALVAATSDDSANLMAIFLGVDHKIKTLVSVVNEKEHKTLFDRLGVHVLVDPEAIVAQHLYGIVMQPSLEEVMTLPEGGQIFQISAREGAPIVGKPLAEVSRNGALPKNLLIVAVRRGEKSLIPTGETVVKAGDHLSVFVLEPLNEKQMKVFTG